MPYNPGISYIGPQLWASALSRFGGDIGDALNKTEEIRKQNALNDPIMQHALDKGLITQEEYNKYHEGNFTTKASMANGVMANIHDDWQRQQFAAEEQDKAMQRALSLQIAHMAHDPSEMAFKPIFGAAPEADPAYADRGLDLTPSGAPVPTQGPQVGIYGERGEPHFFPWREVTQVNPDGTVGQVNVDTTSVPGSTIVTQGGSKNLRIVPNLPGPVGSVMTGENIPENTYVVGAGGKPMTIPKDTRRRMEAAAMPTPSPTPLPAQTRAFNAIWNTAFGTPTPAPTVAPLATPPVSAAVPAQTPVPAVVAPPTAAQKIFVVSPDGKQQGFIPANRLQDYLNANWTQGTPPQ